MASAMASFYVVYLAILNFFSAIWKTVSHSASFLSRHLRLAAPAPELPTVSPNISPVASTIQAFGTNDAMNPDEIEEFYKVFGTPRSSKIFRPGQHPRIARTPPEPFTTYNPQVVQPPPSPHPDLDLKAITGGLNIHPYCNISSPGNDRLSTSSETQYSSDLTTSESLPSSFTSVQLSESSSTTFCSVDSESTTKCADDSPQEIFKISTSALNTKARRRGFFGGPLASNNTNENLKSLLPMTNESVDSGDGETTPDILSKALDFQESPVRTTEIHPSQSHFGPSADRNKPPHPFASPAPDDLSIIEEIATLASIGHFMTSDPSFIPPLQADISNTSMSFEDELETIRVGIEGMPFTNFGDLGNVQDPTIFLSMFPHNRSSRPVPVSQQDVLERHVLDPSECIDDAAASATKESISVHSPPACSVDESQISLPTTLRAAHSATTNASLALQTPVAAHRTDPLACSSTLLALESESHSDANYASLDLDTALAFARPQPNRLQQKQNRSFAITHLVKNPYMRKLKDTNGARTEAAFLPERCSTPSTDPPEVPEFPVPTCSLGSPIVISSCLQTENNATPSNKELVSSPLESSSDISPDRYEILPEPVPVDAFEPTLEDSCTIMAPLSSRDVARMGIENSFPGSHSSVSSIGSDSSVSRYTASSYRSDVSERDRFSDGQISISDPKQKRNSGLRTLLLPLRLGLYDGCLGENSMDSTSQLGLSSRFSVDSLSDDGILSSPDSPAPSSPEDDNDSTLVAFNTPGCECSLQQEKLDALFDALQFDTLVSGGKSAWWSSSDSSDGLGAYDDSEEYEADYFVAS